MNHLTQTQDPKRHADEFDTPHEPHYRDTDLYGSGDVDKEDRVRMPRMRRRPYPRRRPHPTYEGSDDHMEDTVPDSVGSPDLLERIEELKRLQGGGRYPDPHKNDFYEDAHNVGSYHNGRNHHGSHDSHDLHNLHNDHNDHNYNRYKNRHLRGKMPLLPKSSSSSKFSYDRIPLPPFNPPKNDDKSASTKGDEDHEDGTDYYDYGPYGPITRDIPRRISKKIEYMKDLRKNSPFSDKVI